MACFWSKLAYFGYNWRMSKSGPPSATTARLARDFGVILAASAVLVGLLGLARLGRQFPAAAASPGLLVPFLLPVLALALEAGAIVALSTAQLRELLRRASAPSSPAASRPSVRATSRLLVLLVLAVGAAEMIPRGTEHPGAFANELVHTARASCGEGIDVVPVPLLGLGVSCAAGRIEGPMPGVRAIRVAMRELTFSDDLRRVDIVGLELDAARALRVHLVAGGARIVGLAPWSRSPRLSPLGRFAILIALGGAMWLAAALAWAPRFERAPPASAAGTGPGGRAKGLLAMLALAVPGAIVAAGFISLDQERAAPAAYAGAALAGFLALSLVRLLAWRVPKIFSSFNGF